MSQLLLFPRNLSLRVSEATYVELMRKKPPSLRVSGFARAILDRAMATDGDLPSLQPGPGLPQRPVELDWSPFVARVEVLETLFGEIKSWQRETLRAVHEHGSWSRLRLSPQGDEVMGQDAKDEGEQLVRAWERSVGR